jgi:polysaccharide biosynthesis/export protein
MRFFRYFLLLFIAIWFSSCKYFRSNLMLRTPKNYTYDKIVDSISEQDFKIEANAVISVKIFANDGFRIIDMTSSTNSNAASIRFEFDYVVDSKGYVKLPLIGNVKIAGLNIIESQNFLEQLYAEYYVKPFVTVKVMNKRVIVFPGNGGDAKVLGISNNNTTIIEAIALAGGIAVDGKSYKVKLIRNYRTETPKVYLMDLSSIDGLAVGNSIVQANDIIYIEPRYRVARTLVSEITPVLSLITSTILLYGIFSRF